MDTAGIRPMPIIIPTSQESNFRLGSSLGPKIEFLPTSPRSTSASSLPSVAIVARRVVGQLSSSGVSLWVNAILPLSGLQLKPIIEKRPWVNRRTAGTVLQ